VQDDRIKKLYDLGKQLNWDPEMDIDWDRPWPEEQLAPELMNLHDYRPTWHGRKDQRTSSGCT
jgi:hypothetical protein